MKRLETATISEKRYPVRTRADFEALFKANYSMLCSYANGFLHDLDASEEVVQEVMLKIWTGRETLTIDSSVKSYLFRAVRNGCMNVLKHLNVREDYRSYQKNQPTESQRSQEDEVIASELEQKIRTAIDNLPVERRKIFIMSRYDGLTYNQISQALGISVKTVENQMGNALKTLRIELADYLPWIVLFAWEIFKS
ncbi:MAG: RNA polymerase sigma-70 factor [Bacteroidales bacterium]